MKASTYEILQKIMKTELVEVSSEVFDNVRSSEADVSILCIDDTLEYKITYYVSEGNIIGSWENFTGVCRLEESLVPKRERG